MSAFNPDSAASLAGPAWLTQRRSDAAAQVAALEWPSADDEVWRYSPIGDYKLDTFAPTTRSGVGPTDPAWLDGSGPSVVVRLANGMVQSIEQRGTTNSGLTVARGVETESAPTDPTAELTGDLVLALAQGFSADPIVITVAPGAVIDGPVVILHHLDGSATDSDAVVAVPTLVQLAVGADAEVSVIEQRTSSAGATLAVPAAVIEVAPAARVRYTDVQLLDEAAVQLGYQYATVDQSATLTLLQAAMGGEYARMRTDCHLVGRGATGNLAALYFGSNEQTLDFRTFQEHQAADTSSDLLYKGVVDDHSRSVYSGLIRVGPDGRGTNAFQTNRNIKLSPDAWAESVPNLEIEHNEVRCSHASTVGPIDEDQQFYLESRGVRPEDAERLVVAGFFEEVIAKAERDGLADTLRSLVAARLAQHVEHGERAEAGRGNDGVSS
ncbi:MAG: SufD family Fe-S cluster assembly protein [Acidimicrobiales bacterium]|nr:SufD family Fe-S cluster assembly protein [Acidimicrobiales bacterium]